MTKHFTVIEFFEENYFLQCCEVYETWNIITWLASLPKTTKIRNKCAFYILYEVMFELEYIISIGTYIPDVQKQLWDLFESHTNSYIESNQQNSDRHNSG